MDTNSILTVLPLTSCILLDMPPGGFECSKTNTSTSASMSHCVLCPIVGLYVSGESIDATGSIGHTASLFLWFLTTIVGIFGACANLLIILIISQKGKKRIRKSFDTLLLGLAVFDLMSSVFTVSVAGVNTAYFQKWYRSRHQIEAYRITVYIALFCRSCSSFMTVLIAAERFLVVTFPTKAIHWFSVTRAKILICCVALFSMSMCIPRFTSTFVSKNPFHGKDMFQAGNSLNTMEYIVLGTSWAEFWFVTMRGFHEYLDFWAPLPLLLIFNGLVYLKIREINAKRRELNVKHRKELRAAKMFLPVVFILLLCNIEPIVHVLYFSQGVIYRELEMASFLSFNCNSAINLPIYYLKGKSFRKETKELFSSFGFTSFQLTVGSGTAGGGKQKNATNDSTGATSAYSSSREDSCDDKL